MQRSTCWLTAAFALSPLLPHAWAQSTTPPACNLPSPTFVSSAPNIFNDQQEQDLGDALAERAESDLKILPPPPDDVITRVGEKLLATLPPTGIHYRFRIYDSGEYNGFSLAGGRVYISRKIITAVKNEDELAGVVAHEIGHLATHQTALEFTRALRVRLGITAVTDRADIFAKVHQYFSTPAKANESISTEEKDQLAADRVALYAMVRAGYSPQSFVSFLDAVTLNKGKRGNWLSDAAGITNEDSKRYRAGINLIASLPVDCQHTPPAAGDSFLAWQRSIIEERVKSIAQGVVGDQPLTLDPPIHPSPWRIRFSLDGNYILVQDEASIYVVDSKQKTFLFRIDAPDAEAAHFTPDSQNIFFNDSTLRVEGWSIAEKKRTMVKELVLFDGCQQTLLSPDGKTLVCATVSFHSDLPRVDLKMLDVESGKTVYDKPGFYDPSVTTQGSAIYQLELDALTGSFVANMFTSPDGRYLVVAVMSHVLAFDLFKREPVSLGGKLHDLQQQRMAFVGSDRLYVIDWRLGSKGFHQASLFSFPDGRLIKQNLIGDQQLNSVTQGPYLVVSPLKTYAAGILDPETEKLVQVSSFSAVDIYDQQSVEEEPSGNLKIRPVNSTSYSEVKLPLGPLPRLRVATFSPDGQYLAVSMRDRAEIWNLASGKSTTTMRPLRDAWFDPQDRLYAQALKYLDKERMQLQITMDPPSGKPLSDYELDQWQYRDLNYFFTSLGKNKSKVNHARLSVKPMESKTVAWTRDFDHETPTCWPADDDRLVLAWDVATDGARIELKKFPQLQSQLDARRNQQKGILLETVNSATGASLEQVILPEADLSHGAQDTRRAMVSGNFVLAHGEHNNTVIYRLKDGSKVAEFFGSAISTNTTLNLIAATNREDEILLVDEQTGKELERFTLGSPIRLARIIPPQAANDKTKSTSGSLLVLTADQVVHRLPLPR